jgi:multidrug transporter EmrE-like cation transporter
MSPDFPYLIALTTTNAPDHSILGVFGYCLIPSIIILVAWYSFIEKPTLDLLCLPIRTFPFNLSNCLLILFGIIIGLYSHILWDSTSHKEGSFVVDSSFWNKELLSIPFYKLNQYLSGVCGLAALLVFYLSSITTRKLKRGRYTLGVLIYVFSITFFVILANAIHSSEGIVQYAVRSSIGIISGCAIGMCLYALVVKLSNRLKNP